LPQFICYHKLSRFARFFAPACGVRGPLPFLSPFLFFLVVLVLVLVFFLLVLLLLLHPCAWSPQESKSYINCLLALSIQTHHHHPPTLTDTILCTIPPKDSFLPPLFNSSLALLLLLQILFWSCWVSPSHNLGSRQYTVCEFGVENIQRRGRESDGVGLGLYWNPTSISNSLQ
jgi:hypothetical protein